MGQGNSAGDEQALQALLDAVVCVTTALRDRSRQRDALIVLRSPGLAQMAARVTAAFGFRIFVAASTAEAAATAGGRAFNLIVLEADSETAFWARRIRALPGALGAAPIVALGPCAGEAWRDDAADAGVDGFVSDPVTAPRLIDLIALLMGAQADLSSERLEA